MEVRIERVEDKWSWLKALGMLILGQWPGGEVEDERYAVVVVDQGVSKTVKTCGTRHEAERLQRELQEAG